jgi:hypothetical protein
MLFVYIIAQTNLKPFTFIRQTSTNTAGILSVSFCPLQTGLYAAHLSCSYRQVGLISPNPLNRIHEKMSNDVDREISYSQYFQACLKPTVTRLY